jgi:O-Antigen ligase
MLGLDILAWPTLAIGAVLCWIAFDAGGGLSLGSMTTVEMALTIGCGVLIAAAVIYTQAGRPVYGMWSVGLLVAFAAMSAISVVWSVQPDSSWQDAGRMFAYSGLFAAAVVLARSASDRWPAVLGGVILAAVVVCSYALLTKVFPADLGSNDPYARLQEPYGYWNATGLTAAMGIIGCMWLGARRSGHALLSTMAYPAMAIMWVTLMLAYSRGALAAVGVGLLLWFLLVPLRLRGTAVLLVGALSGGLVVAWDFSRHALSSENVALADRVNAGDQLGVLLIAMLILATLTGLLINFSLARRAPSLSVRRGVAAVVLSILILGVIAFAGALAMSHRGLYGSVSHAVSSLTDPHAPVPSNTPGRLTAIASVRARYWNEALKIFKDHQTLGAGAGGYATARLHYRTETLNVLQAHGYVVQTLADLGLVGLAITLALFVAWLTAAGRSTHPFNRMWHSWRWRAIDMPYSAERVGLLSMLCLVVVFGVHSFADWTWYVPGNACVALLCAGWLAGRGPLLAKHQTVAEQSIWTASRPRHLAVFSVRQLGWLRVGIVLAVLLAALLVAWAQWQPQRSADASQQAIALVARNPAQARAAAQRAVDRNPLSIQALFTLSTVQRDTGQSALATTTLQRAVRLQPSNPETWLALGEYVLNVQHEPQLALDDLRPALYLDPQSTVAQNDFLTALRATPMPGLTGATSSLSKPSSKPPKTATPKQTQLRESLARRKRSSPGGSLNLLTPPKRIP